MAVLIGLRGDAVEAERELTEITAVEAQQRHSRTVALLSAAWVSRLLLGALLAIFQQITGINAIVYYAPTILTGFGVSETTALLFGFLNGLVNIATIALVVRSKVVIGGAANSSCWPVWWACQPACSPSAPQR
ncbi:MAG: MFS transporter [Actinomycetota bacterium]|nr:MFS transporter [Actinomycetota bacterium]